MKTKFFDLEMYRKRPIHAPFKTFQKSLYYDRGVKSEFKEIQSNGKKY